MQLTQSQKRLNGKFLVGLLAGLVILVAATHGLHGYQVKRNAGAFLTRADNAERNGELLKAAEYLGHYHALVPGDNEALARYALLLSDKQLRNSPRALQRGFFVLERAVRGAPQRTDLRRRVIELAMHTWLGRHSDAIVHLEALLSTDADDAELLALLGRCHEALGHYPKARQDYTRAVEFAPHVIDHSVRLAYLLRERPKEAALDVKEDVVPVADGLIDNLVKQNAENFQAYLARVRYLKDFAPTQDIAVPVSPAVAADLARAAALAPDDIDVLLASVELAQDQLDHAQARKHLERALQLHAADWRVYQAASRLEVQQGNEKEAIAFLQQGLRQLPRHADLLWNLAHLLSQSEDTSAADDIIARLAALGFPSAELDYLRARVLIARGEWLQAARSLEQIYSYLLGRSTGPLRDWFSFDVAQNSSLLLGICYDRLGDADQAVTAYSRVIAQDPRSFPGRLGLARMEWALGHLDGAANEYRQLVKLPRVTSAALIEAAQLLTLRNLHSPEPFWGEVEQILARLDRLTPPPTERTLLRAEILVARQDYQQAYEQLEKDYQDKAKRPAEIWAGLATVAEQRGQTANALALLDEAERHLGDIVDLRLARARYWARRDNAKARPALGQLASDSERFSIEDRRRLFRGLAIAYTELGEPTDAQDCWRRLAAMQPKGDVGSRLILFDLAQDARDTATMERLSDELRSIEGDSGSLWRYCRACQLICLARAGELKDLSEARALLEYVARRRTGWSARLSVCQGQLHELANEPESAIGRYQQAIFLGVRNLSVIRRTVLLLRQQGRDAEVDTLIQKLQEQTTNLGELERVAAEVALRQQNTALALRLAQKAIASNSTDYKDYLWLGQILWTAGQHAAAEAPLRRALALGEEIPDTWIAYIMYLARTNAKEQAVVKVREAAAKLPAEHLSITLGQCYEILDDLDEAGKHYLAALKASPRDVKVLGHLARFALLRKDAEAAKQYLETIIRLKIQTPGEVAWARRALALLLVSAADDYQQAQKALSIIGLLEERQAWAEGGRSADAVADQRARAMILAAQSSWRDQKQAAALLEALSRRQLLAPEEQLLLAGIYERIGAWPTAREHYLNLLATTEGQLDQARGETMQLAYRGYLAHFAVSLLRHDAAEEALLWCLKLEKAEPDAYRTLAVKAQVQGKLGRGLDMVPLLRSYAEKHKEYVWPVARLLEEIEQFDSAEEMYRQYVAQQRAKKPEADLTLAEYLGRRGRLSDALALCEAAWQTCPPELVAASSVTLLWSARPTPAQCQQVSGWLETALGRNAKAPVLVECLAAVRKLQGRHGDAIALYQQLLQERKLDPLTLNNLAWLQVFSGEAQRGPALQTIQRAIDLAGPVAELLDTRAVVYLQSGQAEQAVKDLNEALAEKPTGQRYFHLAQAHMALNNRREAQAALQQAHQLRLTADDVDPLERSSYQRVCAELERKK